MFYHLLYGRIVSAPTRLPAPLTSAQDADITISNSMSPLFSAPCTPESAYTYARAEDGSVRVRWQHGLEFVVSADGRNITTYAVAEWAGEAAYAYLLSHVISVALLQQGIETLHGGALVFADRTAAIVGDSGYGKSSLAARAISRRAKLMTDDLLVLSGDPIHVLPGTARIKLDPDSAARLMPGRTGAAINDERGKFIYALTEEEVADAPQRLDVIFVVSPYGERVRMERLSYGAAFKELIAATFNPLQQDAPRLAAHMEFHARLARSVDIFRLEIPRRLEALDEVLDLIE